MATAVPPLLQQQALQQIQAPGMQRRCSRWTMLQQRGRVTQMAGRRGSRKPRYSQALAMQMAELQRLRRRQQRRRRGRLVMQHSRCQQLRASGCPLLPASGHHQAACSMRVSSAPRRTRLRMHMEVLKQGNPNELRQPAVQQAEVLRRAGSRQMGRLQLRHRRQQQLPGQVKGHRPTAGWSFLQSARLHHGVAPSQFGRHNSCKPM